MNGLPKGWVEAKISDVYSVARGGSPRPIKDFVTSDPNGLNWIRIADASAGGYRIQATEQKIDRRGLNKTREVFPGDLLLSNSMSFGRPYITDIQGCIHDGWLVLGGPATRHIDAEFAYRCLSSPKVQRQFDEKASGTTVRNLNTDLVSSVHIEIPPQAEQKRIVVMLDALNAKSARARTELARIETLVARYKQALLSRAFSRVDAKRIALLDLTDFVTSGSRGWAKFYSDEGPLFIRIGNTVRGAIKPDLDDIQRVSPPGGAEGIRTRVQPNDIVVTITADLGRIALIDEQIGEAYVNQHLALMRLSNPNSAAFVAWYLVSDEGQALLHRNNRGATRSGLGLDDIRQVEVPYPPPEEQHEIVRRIEFAFAKIDLLAKEAKRALELVARLDEAILAKAFRGELVSQDESDEPAEKLLERIRTERDTSLKVKSKRIKRVTTMPTARDFLNTKLENWPADGVSFQDLKHEFGGSYDDLKEAIFASLSEEQSTLQQIFDDKTSTMAIRKRER